MAKVSVELELELQKLRADLAGARGMIQSELARSFGGGGTGGLATSPAGIIQEMMRKSKPPSRVNFAQAGLGAVAGMFSPWIGATAINQSGALGAGGQGTQLGRLLGGFGVTGFAAAYVGLVLASRALTATFRELNRSVKEGAQLFFDAVRLRTTPGNLKQADVIAKALGVGNNTEIMQALAYGRGGISPANMASMAGMKGQEGASMYAARFVGEDKRFWDEMATNSRNFHVLWTVFSYQVDKLSSAMANTMLPAMNQLLIIINRIGPAILKIYQGVDFLMQINNAGGNLIKRALIGDSKNVFGDNDTALSGAMNLGKYSLPQMGSLERIGYLIGSEKNDMGKQQLQVLKQIAANTAQARGGGQKLAGASHDRINIP